LNNLLEIKSLNAGYKISRNSKIILKNINISAQKGELIALIGANGTGKSTLLKTITGLLPIISGDIFLSEQNLKNISVKEKAKKISFVSTEVVNVTNLKVKDLVALGRFPHTNWLGNIEDDDKKQIDSSLQKVGMSTFAEKFINEISDGERQRVMIARTLAQNTDIIILDEPTAFLDILSKYQLINTLHELSKTENKLIIFSTHDINIALKLCDKIWLVNQNEVLSEAPEDIVLNQRFSSIFNSTDLIFDNNSFDFNFYKEKKYPVKVVNLTNSEICYNLTLKALERNNFFVDENSKFKLTILVNENKYFWQLNENQTCNSISDLIENLNLVER